MQNTGEIKQKLTALRKKMADEIQSMEKLSWRKNVPHADFQDLLEQRRFVISTIDDVMKELGE